MDNRTFTLGNKPYEFRECGMYEIINHSISDFIEVVGGVNSTMLFELGPESIARLTDDHGIKLFNKTDNSIEVSVLFKPFLSMVDNLKGKKFCIDAGHGGKDAGAVNGNHYEKDTALKIALKLADLLTGAGATVYLTRDDDSYPSLTYRASIANNNKCDAFISIHLNAADNKKATGFEVLVYNSKSSSLGNKIASNVLKQLEKVVKWPNRGIKDRPDLTVLKKTTMPAILVEVGFISNDDESAELMKDKTQRELATAIYQGIKDSYG